MKKGIFFKSISYVLIGLLVFNCFFHCPSKAYADDSSKYKGFVPFEIIDDNLEVDGVDCMLIGHNGFTYENDTNYYSYYEIISKDKESCIIKPDMNHTIFYFNNLVLNILHGSVGSSVLYNDSKMKEQSFEKISTINLNTEWLNLEQELSDSDNVTVHVDNEDAPISWGGIAGDIFLAFLGFLCGIGFSMGAWMIFFSIQTRTWVDWSLFGIFTVLSIGLYLLSAFMVYKAIQDIKKKNEKPKISNPYSFKVNSFDLYDKGSNFEIENYPNKRNNDEQIFSVYYYYDDECIQISNPQQNYKQNTNDKKIFTIEHSDARVNRIIISGRISIDEIYENDHTCKNIFNSSTKWAKEAMNSRFFEEKHLDDIIQKIDTNILFNAENLNSLKTLGKLTDMKAVNSQTCLLKNYIMLKNYIILTAPKDDINNKLDTDSINFYDEANKHILEDDYIWFFTNKEKVINY